VMPVQIASTEDIYLRLYGKLISVIDGMVIQNEISVSIAEQVKMSLKNISKPDGVTAHD